MELESIVDTYYSFWDSIVEGSFSQVTGMDYLYRLGSTTPRKSAVKYEDTNVLLSVFFGRNERYLGFGLHVKRDGFSSIHQPHWVMLTDASSTQHTSPQYTVDFPPMRMLRCSTDGELGYSYWLSARRKDTCL